jgi:hypothetical protein
MELDQLPGYRQLCTMPLFNHQEELSRVTLGALQELTVMEEHQRLLHVLELDLTLMPRIQ